MLYARAHAVVGWVATIACCFMYISYIPLILDNLHGVKLTRYNRWPPP
jgi:hypothetical protein